MKYFKFLFIFLFAFILFNSVAIAEHAKLFIQGGIVADDSFSFDPYFWTIGSGVDIPLGSLLSITPEVNIISYEMKFDSFWLEGSAILNANFSNLFVGAGITKWLLFANKSYYEGTDFALKVNAGINGESMRLRAFLITPFDNLFKKGMVIGATFGISF